jgi:hypothetical protein
MKEQLLLLENAIGAKFEDWSTDTLVRIVSEQSLIEKFTPELVMYVLENKKNDSIDKTLMPIKYGFILREAKSTIEALLKDLNEGSKDKEKFRSSLELMLKANSPITRLVAMITVVAVLDDSKLDKREADVISTIKGYEAIMESLGMDESFQIIIELMDVLFPFREIYAKRFGKDLLKDDKTIKSIQEQLNSKAQEMYEFMNEEDEHNHEHSEEEK